jgi:hypothetical protein
MLKHKSALDILSKIVKTQRIKELYKGYSIHFIAYSSSNAIWWETYIISQSLFSKFYQKDKFHGEILLFFKQQVVF